MALSRSRAAQILERTDLGSSIAEDDALLESARVHTSVFGDLWQDRVDLVLGTKGSGKSALYRIFVAFLRDQLLAKNQVVVAHGITSHDNPVFQTFRGTFDELSEDEFFDFWCLYFASMANQHFVGNPAFEDRLKGARKHVNAFRARCREAKIPHLDEAKSLPDILKGILASLPRPNPTVHVPPSGGDVEVSLFRDGAGVVAEGADKSLPRNVFRIREELDQILKRSGLRLWLMADRLDELFPRRSATETRALRALLRTIRLFKSEAISVKLFLRDDIYEQITAGGFAALSHIIARQSDRLAWDEDQILTLVVKRFCAERNEALNHYLGTDHKKVETDLSYRRDMFYRVFPKSVHSGKNQSHTLRWIYTHTMDGRGVVTPRDVIELLSTAKQHQYDSHRSDSAASCDHLIDSASIRYGLEALSIRKRDALLRAEYPHFWPLVEQFIGQKTEYTGDALKRILGSRWKEQVKDLVGIGLFQRTPRETYKIPYLFRAGLDLAQGHIRK